MGSRLVNYGVIALALALGFSGCAGKEVSSDDPAALYQEAEEDISSNHYQIALDRLRAVRNRFPYSKYSVDAQLRIADVYFMQEAYTEAAAAYETFRDLHPKHEKASYAMYRMAKSFFNDIPDPISRDLTPAQKALDAYNEFLREFPDSAQAAEARTDLAEVRKILAQKELYIGNYYFKRDRFDSARPRFAKILELYAETEAAQEARKKLEAIQKNRPSQ